MSDESEKKAAIDKAKAALAKHQTKSVLDPTFRYTSSVETDLQKTFSRIRRERRAKQIEAQVVPLKRKETNQSS